MNDQKVQQIFVEDIIPNRFQPRLTFDEKALKELADSIKVHGVIQPLVLRKVGNKYEIIAGERRYKAACMAGLQKVPAIVRDMSDNESAEVALIENVQRKNLSSIEEAKSYKNLLDRGYLTQEELAKKLGVNQSTIANKLRLLSLCDEVQNALLNEQISERHARSLLQLENPDDQKMMLNRIIKERLTVRQLDNEIKKFLNKKAGNGDTEASDMNENMNNQGNTNTNVNEQTTNANAPYKEAPETNIFGMPINNNEDLEATAPNLNTGISNSVPPASFNPFQNTPMQSNIGNSGNVGMNNMGNQGMNQQMNQQEQPMNQQPNNTFGFNNNQQFNQTQPNNTNNMFNMNQQPINQSPMNQPMNNQPNNMYGMNNQVGPNNMNNGQYGMNQQPNMGQNYNQAGNMFDMNNQQVNQMQQPVNQQPVENNMFGMNNQTSQANETNMFDTNQSQPMNQAPMSQQPMNNQPNNMFNPNNQESNIQSTQPIANNQEQVQEPNMGQPDIQNNQTPENNQEPNNQVQPENNGMFNINNQEPINANNTSMFFNNPVSADNNAVNNVNPNPNGMQSQPIDQVNNGVNVDTTASVVNNGNNNQSQETFNMFGDAVDPNELRQEKQKEAEAEESKKSNFGQQINNIRNTIQSIQAEGYDVESEEYDFEDMYQVIIKIKKDEDTEE